MESFASASLLLKISIPSQNTSKTVRVDTKIKVWELQETIKKKINVTHATTGDDGFGLYWYSDSGPVWLSEGTTLKTYNMKNGDSLEYKKRPPKLQRGTLPTPYLAGSGDHFSLPSIPSSLGSTSTSSVTSARSPRDLLPPLPPASTRQTIASPSISSPPTQPTTSLLSHTSAASRSNTQLEVKGKSNSWVTVRAGTTVFITPAPAPKTNSSPSLNNLNNPNRPPPSNLKISMSELDGIIDSFDESELQSGDQSEMGEYNNYANNDSMHLLDENDNNGSLSFNNMSKSDGESEGNSFTYEDVSSHNERRVGDDNEYDADSYNTSSYNTNENTQYYKDSDGANSTVEKNSEYAFPASIANQASMEAYLKAQQQKMIEDRVNVKVVERILDDALGGIEDGVIDMDMVKMYITSALTILRNI